MEAQEGQNYETQSRRVICCSGLNLNSCQVCQFPERVVQIVQQDGLHPRGLRCLHTVLLCVHPHSLKPDGQVFLPVCAGCAETCTAPRRLPAVTSLPAAAEPG